MSRGALAAGDSAGRGRPDRDPGVALTGKSILALLLEPDGHPAAGPFKEALANDGIPFTSFGVDDVHAEYERLSGMGVRFIQAPAQMGPVTMAVLDDTCGNLIQIASEG